MDKEDRDRSPEGRFKYLGEKRMTKALTAIESVKRLADRKIIDTSKIRLITSYLGLKRQFRRLRKSFLATLVNNQSNSVSTTKDLAMATLTSNLFYIDYETNKNMDFYMVGFSENGESIEQVVLDSELRGFAETRNLAVADPLSTTKKLLGRGLSNWMRQSSRFRKRRRISSS